MIEVQPEQTIETDIQLPIRERPVRELGRLVMIVSAADHATELVDSLTGRYQTAIEDTQRTWLPLIDQAKQVKANTERSIKDGLTAFYRDLAEAHKAGQVSDDDLIYLRALIPDERQGQTLDKDIASQTLSQFHKLVPNTPVIIGNFEGQIGNPAKPVQQVEICHSGILAVEPLVHVNGNNSVVMDLLTEDHQDLPTSFFGKQKIIIGAADIQAVVEAWLDQSDSEQQDNRQQFMTGLGRRLGPIEDDLQRMAILVPLRLKLPHYLSHKEQLIYDFFQIITNSKNDTAIRNKLIDILPILARVSPRACVRAARRLEHHDRIDSRRQLHGTLAGIVALNGQGIDQISHSQVNPRAALKHLIRIA